jgi:hypothetical protein
MTDTTIPEGAVDMQRSHPVFRIVTDGPNGQRARVYVDDVQILNVTKAVVTIDPEGLNRAVVELLGVELEAHLEDHQMELLDDLHRPGPVRMSLTHDEAQAVLKMRGNR